MFLALGLAASASADEPNVERKLALCTQQYDYHFQDNELFDCMTEAAGNRGAILFYTHIADGMGRELDGFYKQLGTAPNPSSCRDYRNQFIIAFGLEEQLFEILHRVEQERSGILSEPLYQQLVPGVQLKVLGKLDKIKGFPCDLVSISSR